MLYILEGQPGEAWKRCKSKAISYIWKHWIEIASIFYRIKVAVSNVIMIYR